MSILSTNSDEADKADKPGAANVAAGGAGATGAGDWHDSLRRAVRSVRELRELVQLPLRAEDADAGLIQQATEDFPVFAPREFVARMEPGNPDDPLLLQVLPVAAESRAVEGFGEDPVGDLAAAGTESNGGLNGLLQKYHGRALLVTTGACAVHCRYCFRRHFPYDDTPRGIGAWQPALDDLAADTSISEVILSGGDPLMLRDDWLKQLVDQIESISHIERLRVHTRLPIMIPRRVNDGLLSWLADSRLAPVMVIHANHARELMGTDMESALRRLLQAGIPVLNQSVLLRGINDSVEALEELSRRLVSLGAIPYYLHQLDRVAGAAHFEVPVMTGRELVRQLRKRVSGYMVPRYVAEVPGELSKTPLL